MDRHIAHLALCALFVGAPLACAPGDMSTDGGGTPVEPTFTRVKSEIFEPKCGTVGCHSGPNDELPRGLRLDGDTTHADLVGVDAMQADGAGVYKLVVAGDPDASLLYKGTQQDVDGADSATPRPDGEMTQMPQDVVSGEFDEALSDERATLLFDWIEAGAEDD